MNKLLATLAVALAATSFATAGFAAEEYYRGGFRFTHGTPMKLSLGDRDDDTYRWLLGTSRTCSVEGDSYERVRFVLTNEPYAIWKVYADCGDTVSCA